MPTYGLWKHSLTIDGKAFSADLVDQKYATRAGYRHIFALNGLPPCFEQALIRASQVCDEPHTWRVRMVASEAEVTHELLSQGRAVLERDIRELNVHVITYVGTREENAGPYEFLAAGALRDKLCRDYQNQEFPVVSRAIVAPSQRGKGLGNLLVEHRVKAALRYFSKSPKAIHFGTDSKPILHSVAKVEREEGIKFVYIGNENYTTADGTHCVHDYLCFLPKYREQLLAACDELQAAGAAGPAIGKFKAGLDIFMQQGVSGILGATLESLFQQALGGLPTSQRGSPAVQLLEEVFFVKHKIGAEDPAPRGSGAKP